MHFCLITAMVGTSVLGLPKSFAYLTWPGGIIALTLAYFASMYTGFRLATLHIPVNRIYEEVSDTVSDSYTWHNAPDVLPYILCKPAINYTLLVPFSSINFKLLVLLKKFPRILSQA
jgi:hypothetical protein